MRPLPPQARRRAAALVAAAVAAAACNEHFITGPRTTVRLELRNWADTLVLGEARALQVRVLDELGREITGVATQVDVGTPALLEARRNATGPNTGRLEVTSGVDSVGLHAARPGQTSVVVTLLDPRFTTTAMRQTATMVVAGVRVASAHDTTLTALGDTSLVVASALARQGTGPNADYFAVPGQGVTWTRKGPGAVRLVGSGDSVRVIAEQSGTDTLVATHANCLAGGRCADTSVVRVAQGAAVGMTSRTFRAWSLGDTVAAQVLIADSRGNAVPGVRLEVVPLTAADSALVAVNTTAGVPTVSRAVAGAPTLRLLTTVAPARGAAAGRTPLAAAAPAVPLVAPPLVAKANGTARVAVRALGPGGAVLASDTVQVVVRQIARAVHVQPAFADLTPGDSIPVVVSALDARGHLIADASFQPTMAGAAYRDGRIVVPPTAPAGQRATLAMAVTGVAQPRTHAEAPAGDPAPDSSRVQVRVPPPVSAGDTSVAAASELTTTLHTVDGRPRPNVWVRFRVPAGSLVGADSVLTDDAGVARARWSLPTRMGTYTASAVVLADLPTGGARPDTAGQIVLRRTATVRPGAPAVLTLRAAAPATAQLGAPLAPAPSVQVEDAYGNPVPQAGITVTVTAPGAASGFTLSGATAVTDANGLAAFPALVGSGATGTWPLHVTGTVGGATPTALTPAVTAPVQFTSTAAPLVTAQSVGSRVYTVSGPGGAFVPVTATGGTAPYTFALSGAGGATLPAGLTFDTATGEIAGAPSATLAPTTFTVTVTDANGATSSQPFTLSANPALAATRAVPTTRLTAGGPLTPFVPVTTAGGSAPVVYRVTGGALPTGVAFDTLTATLSGTPAGALALTTYTVTATDVTGATAVETFTLEVTGAPSAPVVGAVTPGDTALTVAFSAPATDGGSPVTNYEYSTDGGQGWHARSPADVTTPLVIGGLTNGTTYQVALRAVNASGVGAASAAVSGTPRTVPGAPAITAVAAATSELTVAFAPPASTGGAAITTYEYRLDGGAWQARTPAAAASPLVIAGLTNGQTYQVELRAVNAAGAGPASAPASGTPRAVATAPAVVEATPGATSVFLRWRRPANDGGNAVTDYTVEYRPATGSTWTAFSHTASVDTTITVTGLPQQPHLFRVAAVTAAGPGVWSAEADATPGTASAPTSFAVAFQQVTTTTLSARLTWAAPTTTGGSAVTNYTVQYRPSTSSTWTTLTRTGGTTARDSVWNVLQPRTSYDFRVAAVTARGQGAWSPVVSGTTNGASERLACISPGTSNSSANSGSVVPCSGATLQVGDLIVIPVTIGNETGTTVAIGAEAGFREVGSSRVGGTNNGASQTSVFVKVATSADVARLGTQNGYQFTWGAAGNVKSVITLVAYRGVDDVNVGFQADTGRGSVATARPVTEGASRYTLAYFYTMAMVPIATSNFSGWNVSPDVWLNTMAGTNNANAAAVLTADVDRTAAGANPAQWTGTHGTTGMLSTTYWNAIALTLRQR